MADRPPASTSRACRPKTRPRSAQISTCIPIVVWARAKSVQKTQVKGKGKGTGKGKSTKKKLNKAVAVVSSDSEDLEVDFPNHPPNQHQDVPAEHPPVPNPPADIPAKEPQEPNHPLDALAEGPGKQNHHKNQITPIYYQNRHPY